MPDEVIVGRKVVVVDGDEKRASFFERFQVSEHSAPVGVVGNGGVKRKVFPQSSCCVTSKKTVSKPRCEISRAKDAALAVSYGRRRPRPLRLPNDHILKHSHRGR